MSGTTENENNHLNKVVGREYLLKQFVAYNALNKQYYTDLETEIAKLNLKLERVQQVLAENNIAIDFTDIDALGESNQSSNSDPDPDTTPTE